jgi:adhesin transport system outer membrane protein
VSADRLAIYVLLLGVFVAIPAHAQEAEILTVIPSTNPDASLPEASSQEAMPAPAEPPPRSFSFDRQPSASENLPTDAPRAAERGFFDSVFSTITGGPGFLLSDTKERDEGAAPAVPPMQEMPSPPASAAEAGVALPDVKAIVSPPGDAGVAGAPDPIAASGSVAKPQADSAAAAQVAADAIVLPLANDLAGHSEDKSAKSAFDVEGTFLRSLINEAALLPLDVNGVAGDVVESIGMEDAVVFALKNNFEAKASDSKRKSAYWEKIAAYSRYGPTVDVKLSNGTEKSSPSAYNDIYGNRVMNDKHSRRDRVFSVRQPIVDLAVIADIISSANKEDLAEQEDRDAREGIAYDTVSVYLRLMQARVAVHLSEQYRGYLEGLSSRMAARVAGGGATEGDLERIKARATQAESARIEAVGDYETNLAEFKRLTQITPAQLKIPAVVVPRIPSDVSVALDGAIQSNPAYIASLLKVGIASSARDASYAKIAPTLALEYSDTYAYNAGGAAKGNPVDGVFPDQQDKRLMLVAHWVLNGGVEIAEGITGAEKKRQAHYNSQDARSRVEQSIRTSYNAINAANQRMAVLQRGVDSNSKVVVEFEDQYKNGSRSVFELLDAHEQLYAARLNLMRVAIAKAQASYQVRRQMGGLLNTLVAQQTE